MAAEDFKTLREVGIAIAGIKGRLDLMTGVFAVSALIGVGALGYVANRVNTVAEDVAEMKGQLRGFGDQLASIKATIEDIRAGQRQPPEKRSALGVPMPTTFRSSTGFTAIH
jgi:hypothetical protein